MPAMVHNPTLELRCLVAHFECARGSSSERQKLPKRPLECFGGAAGHAGLGAAAGAHRGGRGAEKVELFSRQVVLEIPFAPAPHICPGHFP